MVGHAGEIEHSPSSLCEDIDVGIFSPAMQDVDACIIDIGTCHHIDGVSSLCHVGRFLQREEWSRLRAVARFVVSCGCTMDDLSVEIGYDKVACRDASLVAVCSASLCSHESPVVVGGVRHETHHCVKVAVGIDSIADSLG